MFGAVIGDIVGSPYEFGSHKRKDFPLFGHNCRATDDSVMTIAVGLACVDGHLCDEQRFKADLIRHMRALGRMYPSAGYGEMFFRWLMDDSADSYGSYSNGSAMRVSPVAWAGESLEDVLRLAAWSAEVTHDHPDAIKGAQAVAAAIYLARTGQDQDAIRDYICRHFYDLDFTLEQIRPTYEADLSCEGSVPQAIMCFLEARDYTDAVRNAVSLGGDGDTQAAMAGAIAEAYFGIPEEVLEEGLEYLDETLREYLLEYTDELYANG